MSSDSCPAEFNGSPLRAGYRDQFGAAAEGAHLQFLYDDIKQLSSKPQYACELKDREDWSSADLRELRKPSEARFAARVFDNMVPETAQAFAHAKIKGDHIEFRSPSDGR